MFKKFYCFFFFLFSSFSYADPSSITLSPQQTEQLADFIWQNEGAGKVEYLTTWNVNEDFPSLGIAHFIWYPTKEKGPYKEQFPQLLTFLEDNKVVLPDWLKEADVAPWSSRAHFYASFQQAQLTELRRLLLDTKALQAKFVIKRLQVAIPNILANSSEQERNKIQPLFEQLTATPEGVFALLDYVNFKGEGVDSREQYQGQGWGLKQVLLSMPVQSDNLLRSFAYSADEVLTRRVKNAPREESQWLAGWRKRVHSYPNLRLISAN